MSKVQIGASGSSNWSSLTGQNNYGTFNLPSISLGSLSTNEIEMTPYITINLVKAHGGTIVICRKDLISQNTSNSEYFIIPQSAKNFDRELGKIISLYMLKT